jgi:uncharacterized protein (DUF1697 family)
MIYVSMLRGINVGGHKRIKMDQLRASFEALGFEQVKTYIQSGNVVFKAAKSSTSQVSKRIEETLKISASRPRSFQEPPVNSARQSQTTHS